MLVSVLINNYNYTSYLNHCIQSVLNQNYSDIEIIVYDDGSTDDSLEVLKKYGDKIKVISALNYGKSHGENQANAIYQAFKQSNGDVICLLDSDDMFAREKVFKVARIFEQQEHITTVQNLMLEMDGASKISDVVVPVLKKVNDIKSYIYETNNLFHLFVPTSGLSFRRSFLEKILPLDEDEYLKVVPDLRLCIYSVIYGEIYTIKEPLTYYRVHGNNHSKQRGTLEGHNQYTKEVYSFFNEISALNKLRKLNYSKENLLENTFFTLNLDKKKVQKFALENNDVYIWGAGEAGQSIKFFLDKSNTECKCFIDANPHRTGERVMGLTVKKLDFTKGNKYIISPIHAYETIKEQLEANGFVEDYDFIYPYLI